MVLYGLDIEWLLLVMTSLNIASQECRIIAMLVKTLKTLDWDAASNDNVLI